MANPVLIEVLRGAVVESRHRGAIAIVDADGVSAFVCGDVDRPVFPRSSVKALQALRLIETGAADRYGLTDHELALACASHGGEPGHVATAQMMPPRSGFAAAALGGAAHPPMHAPSVSALYRAGEEPTALHNNCSGKHSGFLCLACMLGADPRGYIEPDHPVQREVKATIEGITGTSIPETRRAVDGCSVPTWAVPLKHLALGFARFGTGNSLAPERAKAAARLRAACAAHSWYVAGSGRFCTEVMQRLGARAFVKVGAEGVYLGTLPERGLGLAVKCDDGGARAAEVVMAALILRFAALSKDEQAALDHLVRPTLRNWNGIAIGKLRPPDALG